MCEVQGLVAKMSILVMPGKIPDVQEPRMLRAGRLQSKQPWPVGCDPSHKGGTWFLKGTNNLHCSREAVVRILVCDGFPSPILCEYISWI